MKKTLLAGLAVGMMMVGMVGGASAAPINWSTGSYYQDAIGDTINSHYDILSITGLSGTIDLAYNTSTTIAINNFDFIAGVNTTYEHVSDSYTASRSLTFGGVSSIAQNYFVNISTSDTLHMENSALYSFDLGSDGLYTIQIAGIDVVNSGGTISGSLNATISRTDSAPVPEPATMLLLGTGLTGLAAARRKKNA